VSNVTPATAALTVERAMTPETQSTDQRHVFNLSAVAQVPKFPTMCCGCLPAAGSFSPILKVKSGPYLTVNLGTDNLLNGEGGVNQRPNLVAGVSTYLDNKSVMAGSIRRRSPFRLRAPRQTCLETSFQAPVTCSNWIMAVSRTSASRQGKSIQVRGEAFNLSEPPEPGFPSRQ